MKTVRDQTPDRDSPCRNCGKSCDEHGKYAWDLNQCKGQSWRKYEATLDTNGERYTAFLSMPVCPHCGVEYQYEEADDLYTGTMVLQCGRWDKDEEPDVKGCGQRYRVQPYASREWSTEKEAAPRGKPVETGT